MNPLVLPEPGHEPLAARLALRLGVAVAAGFVDPSAQRPHGVALAGREVVVVRAVQRAESELLPALMLARRARRLGAAQVFLVAPRLVLPPSGAGAMREALRRHYDGIVAVAGDAASGPRGPWEIAAAGPCLLKALAERARRPFLLAAGDVCPWMEEVAAGLGAPVFGAARFLASSVAAGRALSWDRNPVLLAETVGNARALVGLAVALRRRGASPPLVAVVHADFAPGAAAALAAAGVARVLSTNTLVHPSNQVDVSEAIADALWHLWSPRSVPSLQTGDDAASAV